MTRQRSYGSKTVSRAYHRTSLMSVLVHHDTLVGLNVGSLARSHGMKPAEVEAAIEAEQRRRGCVG